MKVASAALVAILMSRVAGESGSPLATILRGQVAAKEEQLRGIAADDAADALVSEDSIRYPKWLRYKVSDTEEHFIDVSHGECIDHSPLILHWFAHGGENQQWYLVEGGKGTYFESVQCPGMFIARETGKSGEVALKLMKLDNRKGNCPCDGGDSWSAEAFECGGESCTNKELPAGSCIKSADTGGTIDVVKQPRLPHHVGLASTTSDCFEVVVPERYGRRPPPMQEL